MLLYITSGKPRTAQQKSYLMQHVTAQLHQELNIPEQDVMFVIVQNSAEDWVLWSCTASRSLLKNVSFETVIPRF